MIELLQRALQFLIEAIKFLVIALAICAVTVAAFVATVLRFALLALSEVLRFLSQIMRALFCLMLIVAIVAASAYALTSVFAYYQGGLIEKVTLAGLIIVTPTIWALQAKQHPWGALAIAGASIAALGWAVSVLDFIGQTLALVSVLAFTIVRSHLPIDEPITESTSERTPTNGNAEDAGHLRDTHQDWDFGYHRL
jgi:hypothetical protein